MTPTGIPTRLLQVRVRYLHSHLYSRAFRTITGPRMGPSVPAPSTPPLPGSHATAADAPNPAPESTSQHQQQALPALPAPEDVAQDNDSGITVMEVNGAAVALDKLGPMVVAKDGTVSRINNWGEMTQIERENTLRVLGKRNQLRLANLRERKKNE